MFKRALITDEVSQDFEQAALLASKYGLDGLEIRSVWEHAAHELERDEIAEIKAVAKALGFEICAISSAFYKCLLDSDEVRRSLALLDRCIALADELGARVIRGFTFWDSGDFDARLPEIAEQFRQPARMLRGTGIKLALESDPSVYAKNAAMLVQVVQAVDDDSVKALWDPGNNLWSPQLEIPYPDGYELLRKHIIHVHLKDARVIDGKATGVAVGTGDVDFGGQFRALIKDDYSGYVSLETHYRLRRELTDEQLAMPKGVAFSHMGHEATEECLINWAAMMDDITKS